MAQFIKKANIILFSACLLYACNNVEIDEIVFFSAIGGIFPLNNFEDPDDPKVILPGSFVWVEASELGENSDLLLDTFNLSQQEIETAIPETVDLALLTEDANWRFLRTVQLFLYNETGDDSLLIARLDSVATNEDSVISLNANNESIRNFIFQEQFRLKAQLELRDTLNESYLFEAVGINRLKGSIK
ncbi:MAG: hypothetical protein AAGI07_05550 [Bacteroidota bacterium]